MAQPKRDYYEVLGVPPAADPEEVKKAYRSRARELHPDISSDPNAEEKFSEIAEAYQVLSKPTARLLYDRFGYRGWGNGPLPDIPPGRKEEEESGAATPAVRVELEIEPFEAIRGTARTIHVAFVSTCRTCRGNGAAPGTAWRTCRTCEGDGRLKKVSISPSGRLLQIEQCPECEGEGRLPQHQCGECGGSGKVRLERPVEVIIPPGARDGQRIRLTGAFVVLRIRQLPDFPFIRHTALAGLAIALSLLAALIYIQ